MVGAGQGGAGSAIFAQEPPSLPSSPSPHPPPRVPIFLSARHRRRCSLQAVPRRQARPGRLGCYVDALPVSTACCSQLPPVQLACLLFRPGQEEKLEASTHLHHFLLFHVSPSQLLYISSSQVPHCVSLVVRQKETSFVKLNKYWF